MKSLVFASLVSGLVLGSGSGARADDAALLEQPETIRTHVLVHIESPRPVQLESRGPGDSAWTAVCAAPCDKELSVIDEYRFGSGRPFRLAASEGGAVVLKVHPASVGGEVGGGVLVALGGTTTFFSALGLIVGTTAAVDPPSCESSYVCGPALGQGIALVSVVGLLLGGGILAGGFAVLADSEASTTQKPWSGREPTWVGPQSSAPKKAGLFVPLSFSF